VKFVVGLLICHTQVSKKKEISAELIAKYCDALLKKGEKVGFVLFVLDWIVSLRWFLYLRNDTFDRTLTLATLLRNIWTRSSLFSRYVIAVVWSV